MSGSARRGARLGALLLAVVLAVAGLSVPQSAGAAPRSASTGAVGGVDLGPHVYVFTPDMAQSDIQRTVDNIAALQVGNQFGSARYALLFEPGTYGSPQNPLIFQVGYYTTVAGLGQSPDDTVINGSIDVYNQCDASNSCTALDNFWRSLSNLRIDVAGGSGCRTNTEFWAVSQAAPMRRVDVNGGMTLMDYCSGPSYASGGFIADSRFANSVVSGSQQQFVVRNSALNGWSNGVWNQVFVGVAGAPAESFGPGTNQYTTVATTPVEQEEPYLYLGDSGSLNVFVPGVQTATTGPTWTSAPTAGTSLPLSSFFVAHIGDSAAKINSALAAGKNLLFTPGVYPLAKTLQVTRPGTVILGLGMATLTPTSDKPAMVVAGVPGVKISGLIFDAGLPAAPYLLKLSASGQDDPTSPDLLQDVFFRVGGAQAGKVSRALGVLASDVILDNVWAWRADHGTGVGWTQNVADNGVYVSGADVTAYGLFVEHFQKVNVVWDGNDGRVYMFQNELPYDVPSQSAWNFSSTIKGYPALRVRPGATGFHGYGLGSYSFFNQGVDIHASEAFSLPTGGDNTIHDALTVFLNGSGGIDSVVNGVGAPVNASNPSTPSDVIDYP